MEVVLAVITLATAIKDMVKLAEKIHASFEKVSDNLRNAQMLASEIKQTINELKEFCEQHLATLEHDKELRGALLQVIDKLRLFDSDIVPLIPSSSPSPSPSPRLLSRVKGGFKAWRNNDRIDASIHQLREEVKKCQMNFVMMSVARIQVKSNEMHRSTTEGLRDLQQGISNLLVAHNTVSFGLQSSSSSSQRSIEASNQNIVAFAQTSLSTSNPMLKTPSTMKGRIIWDNYLKGQIDSIATSLRKISTLYTTYSIEPLKDFTKPFAFTRAHTLCQHLTHRDPESRHRVVVMQALEIRKILENPSMSTSVQEGAAQLFDLATGLHHVGLDDEAVKMGKWAVSLFRLLVSVDEAIYSPYLIQSLENLSTNIAGDGALQAIEEAVRISERLQTPTAPVEIRIQYSGVLSTYAWEMSRVKGERKRAIELAEQSVKLMEDINGIDLLPPSYEKVNGVVQVSRIFLTRLYQVSPSDNAIIHYVRALRALSDCLMADGRQQESLDATLRVLPIFYDMPSGLAEGMDTKLAQVLYKLVSQNCKFLLPAEKVLEYAEDCVRVHRRLTEVNASRYGLRLCDALWEKGNALNLLNRDSDALEVWKEIADIGQQMILDQEYYADALTRVRWSSHQLKRLEEAVSVRTQSILTYVTINTTTTALQANGQYHLCIDYQLTGKFPEAVEAAKKAVKQYRVLAFIEPHRWMGHIGRALSALADSLLSAGDYAAALNEGHESMRILESHIKNDPECINFYLSSLQANIGLAMTVNDERRAVERMNDILRRMRELTVDFPEKASLALFEAELDYARNLERLGHIHEARKYLEELITKWGVEEHPHVNKEAFMNIYIKALITYAS